MPAVKQFWAAHQRPIKYVIVTALLGAVGKTLLIGAKDGADVPSLYAQFVPVVPMMLLNFKAHKHLWGHPEATLKSFAGKEWSVSYGLQFAAGHGAYTFCVVFLGFHYLKVSIAIGAITMMVTFILNQWKIFPRAEPQTSTT